MCSTKITVFSLSWHRPVELLHGSEYVNQSALHTIRKNEATCFGHKLLSVLVVAV